MTKPRSMQLACPNCEVRGAFLIDISAKEHVDEKGQGTETSPQWGASSCCTCLHCHHQATAGDFIAKARGVDVARYDHAFTIAFSLVSSHPSGGDVTAAQLRAAIVTRLASLADDELSEAVGAPYDSYELDVPSEDIHCAVPWTDDDERQPDYVCE